MPRLIQLRKSQLDSLPPHKVARIAITGGIGSGKTTVADFFAQQGFPRIEADQIAAEVLQEKTPQIVELFQLPQPPNQSIDRQLLAQIVFSNPQKLQQLEELIHPEVAQRVEDFFANIDPAIHPLAVYSVPLLAEKHTVSPYHCTITVSAPKQQRLQWLKKRSQLTPEQVQERINAQATQAQRRAISDYEIVNDASREELEELVVKQLLPALLEQLPHR